jgi:hypothetical protein
MLSGLAAAYVVQALSPDAGFSLAMRNTSLARRKSATGFTPPWTIAMAGDGRSIAFVQRKSSDESIVFVSEGNRRVIPSPPRFPLGVYGSNERDVPEAITRIRLTEHGTIFATLSASFAGAFMGVREETYIYANRRWRQIVHPFPGRCSQCPDNVVIAAAQSPSYFALTSDFEAHHPVAEGMFESNPGLFVNTSTVVVGQETKQLGTGDVLAMNGTFAVGYVDAYKHLTGIRALTATLWRGTKRTTLGLGVAFGVDVNGDVVGDDRTFWNGSGHPVLWTGLHHQAQLMTVEGSAYSIRNDVIVGAVNGRAFGMSRTRGARSAHFFEQISDSRWHITTAFSIGSNGRILALGRRGAGGLRVLSLSPSLRRTK